MLYISELKITFGKESSVEACAWVKCTTPSDVEAMIEWLNMAKGVMLKWEKINARASRAAKATAGKDETPQQREIQRAA